MVLPCDRVAVSPLEELLLVRIPLQSLLRLASIAKGRRSLPSLKSCLFKIV